MKRQEYKLLMESWNTFLIEEEKRLINEQMLVESVLLNENIMKKLRNAKGLHKALNTLAVVCMLSGIAEKSFAQGGNPLKGQTKYEQVLDAVGVDEGDLQDAAQALEDGEFDEDEYQEAKNALSDELPPSLRNRNQENLDKDNVFSNTTNLKGSADFQKYMTEIKSTVDSIMQNEDFGLYEPDDMPDDPKERSFLQSMTANFNEKANFDSNSKSDVVLMNLARSWALTQYFDKYKSEIAQMTSEEEVEKKVQNLEGDNNISGENTEQASQGDSDIEYRMAMGDQREREQQGSIFSEQSVSLSGDLNALVISLFMSQEFSSHLGLGDTKSSGDLEKSILNIAEGIDYEASFVFLAGDRIEEASEVKTKLGKRLRMVAKAMKLFYARNHSLGSSGALNDDFGTEDNQYDDSNVGGEGDKASMLDDQILSGKGGLVGEMLKLARLGAIFTRSGSIESKKVSVTKN